MASKKDIDTRLKNLLCNYDDEYLEPMRQHFTGEPTPEQTAQGVLRLVCACGYGTLAPRENDPAILDTFFDPCLKNIKLEAQNDSVVIHDHGYLQPRAYNVRNSAKDRHDLILALHRRAESRRVQTSQPICQQQNHKHATRTIEDKMQAIQLKGGLSSLPPASRGVRSGQPRTKATR